MSVSVLPSSRLRSARANLEHLVSHARNEVAAFGVDLQFDADVWNVCGSQATRASAKRSHLLYFTTHEGGRTKGLAKRDPFTEPFASFIKAIIRLKEERGHISANLHVVAIRAARYLYDATVLVGHDPCRLTPFHFHEAANLCRTREMESSRYRVGRMLVSIADWVNSYNISAVRIDFKNPFPRADHDGTRIGAEADGRRAERMPSAAALDGLARIANHVEQPRDILCMRAIELLVCGGWRINEALTLPADCEIIEGVFKNGEPVVGPDGHLLQRYGIRYFGEKGAGARTKWIPTPMVDVAKRAVSDILQITESARKVAIWMKQHPGQAWLAGKWAEAPDDATMTAYDVAEALGRPTKASGLQAIRRFGIRHGFSGRAWVVMASPH